MPTFVLFFVLLFSVSALSVEVRFFSEPGGNVVEMFERPNQWQNARNKINTFGFFALHLEDECGIICNGNVFGRFFQAQAFRQLSNWEKGIAVGVGSVKPEIHCDAKIYAQEHSRLFAKVKAAGGKITSFTMDWPRAAGKFYCNQTLDETARHVANYARYVQAAYGRVYPGEQLDLGLWEGYPTFEYKDLVAWIEALIRHGYTPTHFIADIDRDHHKKLKRLDVHMMIFLKSLQRYSNSQGIKFGIAFWSNDMESPAHYRRDILNWVKLVKKSIGVPEIIEFNSWEYWVQKQNVGPVFPYNLPDHDKNSHTGILLEGLKQLGL